MASQISSAHADTFLGRRMLRSDAEVFDAELAAEAHKDDLKEAGVDSPGQLTDWIVPCEANHRKRCPSAFLASWGYQCQARDTASCCLLPTGRFCVPLAPWADSPVPANWTGLDKVDAGAWEDGTDQLSTTYFAASPGGATASDDAGETSSDGGKADKDDDKDSGSDKNGNKDSDKDSGKSDKDGKNDRDGQDESEEGSDRDRAPAASRRSSGWSTATATHYTSYPDCCHSRSADQSECEDYNGCEWQGYFAAYDNQKSRSWVRSNNIVAFYQTGMSEREWSKKWKGATLRIRNPKTGDTLDVKVVDTCGNSDCNGCCSANANRNGGTLIDLEVNTARRFYGRRVQDMAKIEWQRL